MTNFFKLTALSSVDTYKLGHVDQLPVNTDFIYSNFTPRFNKHFAGNGSEFYDGKIVVAGVRFMIEFINDLWNETFFNRDIEDVIAEYVDLVTPFVTGSPSISHIIQLHQLGYLPLEFRALPEGVVVNPGIPTITVCNTVRGFGWLVGFMEDIISAENWKPSTNATTARVYRKMLDFYAEKMGVPAFFVNYQGHDFSLRGLGGIVDGSNSGQGHLMYFEGTDNLPAANRIRKTYGDSYVGCSVSATEHLVSSSNILTAGITDKQEAEEYFFNRYITEIYPSGICSYVADTYNYWKFLSDVLPKFVDKIMQRGYDANGLSKVVIRPDSGDPVNVVCGYRIVSEFDPYIRECVGNYNFSYKKEVLPEVVHTETGEYFMIEYTYDYTGEVYHYERGAQISEVEAIGTVRHLINVFGATVNDNGYLALNDRVGVIYGDSITIEICNEILMRLDDLNIASSAVVFGIGSFTYNFNTRDSLGYAMKGTWCRVDGNDFAIYKDPITSSSKKSAHGLLSVVIDEQNEYRLIQNRTLDQACMDTELRVVFRDSQVLLNESFADVRKRALANV